MDTMMRVVSYTWHLFILQPKSPKSTGHRESAFLKNIGVLLLPITSIHTHTHTHIRRHTETHTHTHTHAHMYTHTLNIYTHLTQKHTPAEMCVCLSFTVSFVLCCCIGRAVHLIRRLFDLPRGSMFQTSPQKQKRSIKGREREVPDIQYAF